MADSHQIPLTFPYMPSYRKEDYCRTSSNHEVFAWVSSWPNWSAHASCIYGPSGSGKTHLAAIWQRKSHAQILKPAHLTGNLLALFKDNKNFILDPIESFLPHYEEELLHLYNLALELKGALLLLAETPPSEWSLKIKDLKSRLLSMPSFSLSRHDDILLKAILIKTLSDYQLTIREEDALYILTHMERSYEKIKKLGEILNYLTLEKKHRLTLPLLKEALLKLES